MSALVFCVEASAQAGMGHLMRCIALAQASESQNIASWFVLPKAVHDVCRQRHDWPYGLIEAAQDENCLATDVLDLADKHNAMAIVMDGYGFSAHLAARLATASAPLILLDDIQQDAVRSADIIVNPAGEAAYHRYEELNPEARLCLGAEYRLLRREFVLTKPLPFHQRHTLTLNFGGSDPKNLTLPILQALVARLPDALIRVVTGPSYIHTEKLKRIIDGLSAQVQHLHDCQDMAQVWSHARLAIAAAGGSQFELVACYTPSILLTVADNQKVASQQASKQQWCELWDACEQLDIELLIERAAQLWRDESRLQAMHNAAKNFAVVNGADRVLKALAAHIEETQCDGN